MPQSMLQWFSLLFVLALYLIPVAKLLQRVGYRGYYCFLFIVPLVNLVVFWGLAFLSWPIEDEKRLAEIRANPRQ